RRSTNCSTKSARPSTPSLESWPLPQEGNSDGNDKVGTQGIHHLAAAQPDLYVRGGIHGDRSYRVFSLLSVHLRQQPPTEVLHAHLHPIERCRSNRNKSPRQLPDARGGRSRNSAASSNEHRRDRRHDAATGRQGHPARALAARLAARLYGPLLGPGAELYRRVLECLSQECGLRQRWPFRSLQAPAAFRSAITGHPAPVFHRQGHSTAQGAEIRKTTERPRDDDSEGVQRQGRRRWHRHQDRRDEDNDPHSASGGGPAHADHRRYRSGQDYDHAPNTSADKTSWRFRDRLRPRTGVRQTLLRPEKRRRYPESAR